MKHSSFRRRHGLQWATAVAAGTALPSFAQSEWPKDKSITFVVPFTAGSGTDVIARTVAEKLGRGSVGQGCGYSYRISQFNLR